MAIQLPKAIKYEYVMMLPGCADFMSASVRAMYDHIELDSAVATYRIEIYIKNWVRQCAFHFAFEPLDNIIRITLPKQQE